MCPEIKRIHAEPKYQSESGDYVLHSDHEAEIARLRAELQNAAKAALDATVLACEKEREADALRVEVEKYQKAVRKVRARADSEGTAKQHGMQYVAGLRNAANMIDAAIGEGK